MHSLKAEKCPALNDLMLNITIIASMSFKNVVEFVNFSRNLNGIRHEFSICGTAATTLTSKFLVVMETITKKLCKSLLRTPCGHTYVYFAFLIYLEINISCLYSMQFTLIYSGFTEA